MNTIGIALVWCIAQVTFVSLMAAGLYLLVRRLRPAAAATVVLTGLAIVMLLSLMALSPWPHWTLQTWTSPLSQAGEGWGVRADDVETASANNQPSAVAILSQALLDELANPSAAEAEDTWHWPAIVAIVLFVAAACGLGWLLLGIAAVRRQWLRSQPVLNREVLELVDVLRAELGCVRPVEVRQCDDLATAATIGWRRPVVLLSSDWPTWTNQQCRAVLAHEIAHARSHDFLALLFGQLGVMLHLYHPLLHWLMNRLRLEQELAADAVAASVTGGQRAYLSAIAELALQSQGRPMSWPARTFLPTDTTFLRRIAMLRNSTLRFGPLSPAARLAVIGLMLLCGLLAAGVRGPGSQTQVLAADPQKAGGEEARSHGRRECGDDGAERHAQVGKHPFQSGCGAGRRLRRPLDSRAADRWRRIRVGQERGLRRPCEPVHQEDREQLFPHRRMVANGQTNGRPARAGSFGPGEGQEDVQGHPGRRLPRRE